MNHDNCTAGRDTRRRLYVKRNPDGSIVAHCHNCNESGFIPSDKLGHIPVEGEGKVHMPPSLSTRDLNYDPNSWPREPYVWFRKYGIDPGMMMNWGWDDKEKQLVYSLHEGGERVGYQARTFKKGSPKYITELLPGKDKSVYFTSSIAFSIKDPNKLIICEDILSSLKLLQGGYNSVCLLGTTLSEFRQAWILKNSYSHIIIHLDSDPAGVEGTKKIKRVLPSANYILNKCPKEIPISQYDKLYL